MVPGSRAKPNGIRPLNWSVIQLGIMLKSTVVSDAEPTKQTPYVDGRSPINRVTYERAMESVEAVNIKIRELIHGA